MMNQYIKYYGILSALFVFVCTAHARPALTIYPYLDDEFREQMLSLDGQPAFLKKFTSREVISNLNFPYEILYGPDKWIWVTERTGKKISRINPVNGEKKTLITIHEVFQSAGQDGLLGLALHPSFLKGTGKDYIYTAYIYDTGNGRQLKLRRYTYNAGSQTLQFPKDLITGLSASGDHNSGRLIIKGSKIFYSIGDQGANQFSNKCTAIEAQRLPTQMEIDNSNWDSYKGKILRINLDGSIPIDNPILDGVQSHIFSYGHRNPQGLTFANDLLYSAEHGPKTDDEINLISSGNNYGWPHIAGFQDDMAYAYCDWSSASDCESLNYSNYSCPSSVNSQSEFNWNDPLFTAPLKSLFVVDNGFDFRNPPGNCSIPFICWPTIAPSSILYYNHPTAAAIPELQNSLLVTSLKKGTLYQLRLNGDGSLVDYLIPLFQTQNRFRDIAVSSDGNKIFIATDKFGQTSGPSDGNTNNLENRGAILELTIPNRNF
jgi:PQQ-dependent dehydrogenase (s-GDH family)